MGIFYENNNEKIKEILDKKICFLFLCELMNFLSGPAEAGGWGRGATTPASLSFFKDP